MKYYPIAIKLGKKPVVVVGGGAVAERKVKSLLEAGARVTVISPTLTAGLRRLAGRKAIGWRRRLIREVPRKAALVVAATSNERVNRVISWWLKKRKTLVNVVDRSELSNFITPAVFRTRKAIVAVYTDGQDPVLSRDLKNFLKEYWDEFLSYRDRP